MAEEQGIAEEQKTESVDDMTSENKSQTENISIQADADNISNQIDDINSQEEAQADIPQSEKIKMLNVILNFVGNTKPIIYDKCIKTGITAMSIFNLLNMNSDEIKNNNNNASIVLDGDDLIAASYLANVGFIGIPEYILYKQGLLMDNEYEIVKQHTKISANVCMPISPNAYSVILDHHELPLARGYSKKMSGVARSSFVIGVADRFVGSMHMVGSLYRPANSRYDALKNAMEFFDSTSPVFSVDEINGIADLLLSINL
jgi:response regulator RpfG family c-di-GMP phosphodiesterase